jgi:Flp pilus assembly protein TadD
VNGNDADSPRGAADVRAALAAGRVTRARDLALGLGADDTSTPPLLVEVGTALLAAGSTTDAVTCLDRAIEIGPTHPEARYRRALGLLALGRSEEARRDFEALLELAPDGPHAAKARLALEELPEVAR